MAKEDSIDTGEYRIFALVLRALQKRIPTKSREANEYRERLQYLQSNKLHWKKASINGP